jgi:ubiquinone/menaquinone biosynthesis C-methylase UbiE
MLRLLLDDKLYRNPLKSPRRVLDVGTGTGIWAIDLADEHPSAEVIGVDISPTQPELVPPNCRFELDDVCSPWTFPLNHFDFIHVRCLFGSVADWPQLYREIYDHLEPGGYIEELEMDIRFRSDDGTVPNDHVMAKWSELFIEAGETVWKKTFKAGERSKQLILDAGFEDVNCVKYKVPVGGWSSDPKMKEIGRWNFLHCYQGAEGWALYMLTQVMNVCGFRSVALHLRWMNANECNSVEARGGADPHCAVSDGAERPQCPQLVRNHVGVREEAT